MTCRSRFLGESISEAIDFAQDQLRVTRPEAEQFLFHLFRTKKVVESELGYVEDPTQDDGWAEQYKRHQSTYRKALSYHRPRMMFHKDRVHSSARSRYPRKKMAFSDVAEDMMNHASAATTFLSHHYADHHVSKVASEHDDDAFDEHSSKHDR